MARLVWKDRKVERPRTFNVVENADGTITLEPSPGMVEEAGTPVNAANLNAIEDKLDDYNSFASNKDDNGIFTVVEYRRDNNILYLKSTLSNADEDGNYQTLTWEFYDNTGTTIIETILWNFIYDEDGDIVSKVVVSS